jgi:zinc finger SWIM domain-containing protein 3
VGQTFESLKDLEATKNQYEDSHFCELWERDVRTLTAAAKRVAKRASIAKEELLYYSLKLTCKFGGRAVSTREKRKRATRSFRQVCSFEVYITSSEDGKYIQVQRTSKEHNHPLKKEFYKRLPRQRATRDSKVAKEMEDALKLQVNHKLLKERI